MATGQASFNQKIDANMKREHITSFWDMVLSITCKYHIHKTISILGNNNHKNERSSETNDHVRSHRHFSTKKLRSVILGFISDEAAVFQIYN